MSGAYYNEIDPYAAQWLKNLIAAGHIAPGDVDERSIEDVQPEDVRGYTQCHFFAGIGGWSYALRLAGWADDRPVWTGSCPCQPFSSAGAAKGGADARHLWPHWARLIGECRPVTVFGEQVEAAIAHGWLDAVFDDLEGLCYACGSVDLPAASVGAPHKRQRLWFVADAAGTNQRRHGRGARSEAGACGGEAWPTDGHAPGSASAMGHADSAGHAERIREPSDDGQAFGPAARQAPEQASPWSDVSWIGCSDGKSRPVEPGTFPLAHGVSARVGRLRAYGNAIVPQVAAEFIAAYLEVG